jgi:hypothetical protein
MHKINVPQIISFINVVCRVINVLPVANCKSKIMSVCVLIYWILICGYSFHYGVNKVELDLTAETQCFFVCRLPT